ncbi:MAG: FAD-dependent oxidoreductase, partial [Bifidobacteriaceae bacterium]|nr:FAD-dependent oxidoreductase [Bifidobacteriaceae bacterium]
MEDNLYMASPPFPGFAPEQWRLRPIELAAAAHDASHYLVTPRARLVARDVADVRRAIVQSRRAGLPVTFRSGGTSLSGQASGPGLLVDVRQAFQQVTTHDGGRRVTAQGGATLRSVNARLADFGHALGPDPASEVAATIGGVVANNSSGMACGTEFNAYRTLASLKVVLASGTVIDTGAPDADQRLLALEPALCAELARLRQEILASPAALAT